MPTLLQRLIARRALKLGNTARDMRKWSGAASAFRRYLDIMPDDTDIWVQLGHALKECGDHQGAETAYDEALALKPDDSGVHLQIGHLLKITGRRNEAVASYRKAIVLDASNHDAAQELAALSAGAGPRQLANNTEAEALRSIGDASRDNGKWHEAADAYKSYLEIVSSDDGIRVQLGHVLREAGSFEQAEEAYRKAIESSPDLADAWFHHGLILKVLGRWKEAETAFGRVLELDPSDKRAQQELSNTKSSPRSNLSPTTSRADEVLPFADEQSLLMQSQSRAMRALATELVKLRSEVGAFELRLTQVVDHSAEREKQLISEIERLRSELAAVERSCPPDPFTPLSRHLRDRSEGKHEGHSVSKCL